jgi:hypothetical protein
MGGRLTADYYRRNVRSNLEAGRRRKAPTTGHSGFLAPETAAVLRLQRLAGNRAVSNLLRPSTGATIAVQRIAVWGAGVRNRTLNMVHPATIGTDFGTTFIRLNGVEHPVASLNGAMQAPGLTITQVPSGGADVAVTQEPTNTVSYRIDLPTAPPWKETRTKDEAGRYIRNQVGDAYQKACAPVLNKYVDGEGNVEIRAVGNPNDERFNALVEEHEDVHVSHARETFENILSPWDAKIAAYKPPNPPFHTASPAPGAAFYTHIGFTPQEIGSQIENHFAMSGRAFHDRKEGGSPLVDHVEETGLFRKTLNFRWKHPMA